MRARTKVWSRGVFLILGCFVVVLAACRSPISIGPASTATSPPEVTAVAAAATITIPPELATELATPSPTETPVPPPPTATQPKPTTAPTVQCTVQAARGLRVRAGPGTNHRVTVGLPSGEVVTARARNADSTWLAVRTRGGQEGWVAAQFVACNPAINTLPVQR